jgi:hypothetical protein
MPSSSAAASRGKTSARKKKTSSGGKGAGGKGWITWLPVLLGIAVTPFAVRFASIVALEGPRGLAMLYPWVLLLKEPALGFSSGMGNDLSQLMMYLQFPLYGLFMKLVLNSKGWLSAILSAGLLHLAGIVGIIALAWLHASS